jgi:hypothetical protein
MSDYICSTCGAKRNSFEELFAHKASCRGLVTPPNPGIADEIRKALEAATPGPWEVTNLGDVHITKDYRMVDGRHIAMWIADMCVDRENEDQIFADAHLIANAPEWLRWQQGEIERLNELVKDIKRHLGEEIAGLEFEIAEKNKVLEWYADEDTHEIKRRVLGDFAPITLDKGHRARDILAKYAKEEETK